jgi:D-alanyl-D-alanine carboxypeptidase
MQQALTLAALCACAPPAPHGPDVSEQLDAIARAALRDGGAVGISIAIAHGDNIDTRAYGFADRDKKIAASPYTIYPLGSLSKQYWAASVVQLGIDLDSSLADILYKLPDRRIRVRDILQQTSGFGDDHDGEDDVAFTDMPPLAFPPGTWWQYSNRGAILARRAVEQVSGQTWAQYLHDHIAAPLQLDATSVCGDHVQLYSYGKPSEGEPPETWRRAQFVCSNVLDVVKFERWLDKVPKLRTPVVIDGVGEVPYGLLTRIADVGGHKAYGHTGGFIGLSVAAFRFPAEDVTIVVLMNSKPKPGFEAWDVLEQIARAELGVPVPPERPAPPELLAQISGNYTVGAARGEVKGAHATIHVGETVLYDGPLAWRGGRTFVGHEQDTFLPAAGPVRAMVVGGPMLMLALARRVEPPDP